ncbi:hypothetical protein GCM10017083_44070 [Thalassobaculum fulvum]|uniref:Dicarboxylate transport domain-containing protein n=1 Tax=Thalassobaculum fulvum TaxID=1633335 RepID=A0A918XVN6_9PROT|nr:YdbH domain-containing protein [Thalassobaculum fulvum]GHD59599.1 hypothetical protein GCM10017083_44070 [Thalassobaculum fulvum]
MRWLGRAVLILLAVVAVLAPALWVGRDVVPPRIVRWAVNQAAGVDALDDLAFRIEALSLDHVELVDLRVNRDAVLTAERIRIAFDPAELLGGRLRAVTATGAVLDATVAPDGALRLGSLDPLVAALAAGRTDSASDRPAVRRIELRDAAIRLDGAARGRLRLEGTAAPTPGGGLAAGLAWRLAAVTGAPGPLAAGLSLEAEGRATLDRDAAGARTGVSIAAGRLRREALDVVGMRGTATLSLPASGGVVVAAELSAGRVLAGGAAVPAPAARLRYDETGLSGTVRLGPEADPEAIAAAVADAAGADGRRPVRLELSADLARLDGLLAAWTGRQPLNLRGTAQAEAAGSFSLADPAPAAVWSSAVAAGGLSVSLADGSVPSLGRLQGTARLAAALAAGRLAVETAGPVTLRVQPEPPPDATAPGFLAVPATVTAGTATTPLRALLQDLFGDPRVVVEGPVAAVAADGANGTVAGRAVFRPGATGWRLDRVERATVQAAGIRHAGIDLERLDAGVADLTVGPSGPAGEFELSLRASAPERGVVGAAVTARGRVETGEDGVRVLLSTPARLTVDRLAPAAPVAPIERLAVRVAATNRAVLTVPLEPGPVLLDLPVELPALAVASARADAWRIDLEPLRATVSASLEPSGDGRLRVRLTGASAAVAPAGVTLDGLAADLRLDLAAGDGGSGAARLRRLDVTARRVADRDARLARFAPLSLEGVAHGAATARSPDRLAFRMTLRGADGAFVLDADGHHVPSSGRGEAELTLFPIRFVPGGLQPADLSPAAAALFRDASGEVSLGGRVRWPGEAVPPDDPLTLTLKDLGFSGSLGTVTGLSGAVAVTRVDPPATAPAQELTATAADVGIPIVAPRVRFRLEPDRVLRLESVEARFADGRVSAEDVAVPLGGRQPVPVVLKVERVDAARLAEIIDLDGLSATGTLSGWLPLLWDPETGLAVRQARLTAGVGGGSLRYQPSGDAPALQDSGEQVSLLLRAIRNFVYESFEVEADGRPGEPFDVRLRLRGANPDLFDGYPIALNVTLSGALDQLFGEIRRNLGLSDVIRRRLEATGGG